MKTSELTGAALDWAVAKCEGHGIGSLDDPWFAPSTDWSQGGPIIEREKIDLRWSGEWAACLSDTDPFIFGPTPLIAAMRCYVASKLGNKIEIPEELK